ncbi:MAG: hypothetical protein ACLPZR_25030 [Solirubrobacteraceae bacterium]
MSERPEVGFDDVVGLWEDGRRRLTEVQDAERAALDAVVDAIVNELRRRVGEDFTTDDLAGHYLQAGTDWCFELATRVAPSTPAAWDMTTAAGAAFAQYVRQARDFGGGRRLRQEDEEGF